ncbi:MAG: flagellar biosynthesis protein FlgJ [Alphaproteobacteria bacterium]|nr:flagellar biosynthesis protein FlgJ [Alphaproteobacteria bacterium]
MEAIMQDTSLLLSQSAAANAKRNIDGLKANGEIKNIKAIEDSAREFEAVFLSAMLKPIFEQIEVDGLFGGGKGEEVFRGMMVQEYGKMIAQTGTIGIADQVKAELIRIQEDAQ